MRPLDIAITVKRIGRRVRFTALCLSEFGEERIEGEESTVSRALERVYNIARAKADGVEWLEGFKK